MSVIQTSLDASASRAMLYRAGDIVYAPSAVDRSMPKPMREALAAHQKSYLDRCDKILGQVASSAATHLGVPAGHAKAKAAVEAAFVEIDNYEAAEGALQWARQNSSGSSPDAAHARQNLQRYQKALKTSGTKIDELVGKRQIERLKRANENYALAGTVNTQLKGKQGLKSLMAWEADPSNRDAASASVAATNATLWTIRFGYHTGKARQAWLTDLPADNKLELVTVLTPSSHNGDANYEQWARNNKYNVEIAVRKPGGSWVTVHTENFGIKNPPEYASASAETEIDLSQYRGGEIRVIGWPNGSARVGGYREDRETIIHIPK